jgi:tetratricopeptide (TPR) repeat protein
MNRRIARWSLAAAPFALLLLVELAVRAMRLAPPLANVVLEDVEDAPGQVRLRALGIMTDTPHVAPAFTRQKAAGTFRIAWFGESAAAGFPFDRTSRPAMWIELLLRDRLPTTPLEVIDCAIAGLHSEWIAEAAELVLPLDVDLAIVFAGNNEFLGSFLDRRERLDSPGSRLLARVANVSHLVRFAAEERKTLQPRRTILGQQGFIDPPLGPLRERVLEQFAANLGRIDRAARDAGCELILLRPVAARRDCAPFSSTPSRPLERAAMDRARQLLQIAGESIRAGDLAAAESAIATAEGIDADLALVHFRRGELADRKGDPRAAEWFTRALDGDERPIRVNARVAAVIEKVARNAGRPYYDADAAFCAMGGDGCPPRGLLVDHCHLAVEGQWRLAEWLVARLKELDRPRPAAEFYPGFVHDFSRGLSDLKIGLAEAVSPEVQIGFAALAVAFGASGDREKQLARARDVFDRVLAVQPDQPKALCGRGLLAAAEGRVVEAQRDFEAAFALAPRVVLEVKEATERFAAFEAILERAGLRFDASGRLVPR